MCSLVIYNVYCARLTDLIKKISGISWISLLMSFIITEIFYLKNKQEQSLECKKCHAIREKRFFLTCTLEKDMINYSYDSYRSHTRNLSCTFTIIIAKRIIIKNLMIILICNLWLSFSHEYLYQEAAINCIKPFGHTIPRNVKVAMRKLILYCIASCGHSRCVGNSHDTSASSAKVQGGQLGPFIGFRVVLLDSLQVKREKKINKLTILCVSHDITFIK